MDLGKKIKHRRIAAPVPMEPITPQRQPQQAPVPTPVEEPVAVPVRQ